jgi:2-polyprenyl-3-methyl-5-hydroxy-6-metoxy-1,4-benzoquinol methylase
MRNMWQNRSCRSSNRVVCILRFDETKHQLVGGGPLTIRYLLNFSHNAQIAPLCESLGRSDAVTRSLRHSSAAVGRTGETALGLLKNWEWYDDPRSLLFSLARYKFVARIFESRKNVLEIGCGDAFCAPIVKQAVKRLTVTDFDPLYIADAKLRMKEPWIFEAVVIDIRNQPLPGRYDGIYALDVLEHIPQSDEDAVMQRIVGSLTPDGAVIIGMPSIESQNYASAPSKAGHINCKTEPELRALMSRHFNNVFMFGMNDEVVHTGFAAMAHYRLALACGPRK